MLVWEDLLRLGTDRQASGNICLLQDNSSPYHARQELFFCAYGYLCFTEKEAGNVSMGPELGTALLGLGTFLNTHSLYSGGSQDALCVYVAAGRGVGGNKGLCPYLEPWLERTLLCGCPLSLYVEHGHTLNGEAVNMSLVEDS